MLKKIILMMVLTLSANAASCWSKEELASFAQDEFDNKARLSVRDAVTCEPISNVKFYIGSTGFDGDAEGIVTIPLPPEEMDMDLPITIEKSGYITAKEGLKAIFGSYWNNLFIMSKELPMNSVRFSLSWGDSPSDLDLQLKCNSYHISFRKTIDIANTAKLDRDAMKGYGPETITVDKLNESDTYKLLVNRYSNSGTIDNKTQVRVYVNNKIDRVVRLDNTSSKCLEVATITNNKISYETKELNNAECN